jgi:LPXTG-site transpeptidase (sortase) family protein
MKASAPILLSVAAGALVAVASVGSRADGDQVPALQIAQRVTVGSPDRAASQTTAPHETTLAVPRLRLKARIGRDLDEGPAWWPVTGRPGGGDTIAIAGHRTTHTRPFYWLERLQPGDAIQVRWQGDVHAYRVSGRRILSAEHLHIADARGHEVLLLSACNPRGSARQRIVVYAWPVD